MVKERAMKVRSHCSGRVHRVRLIRIPFLEDGDGELHAVGDPLTLIEASSSERRALRRAGFRFANERAPSVKSTTR
ncbi:MAG: hypothetical protein AB1689_12415 [Thermodesulfobacteriota bacterium]